MSEEEATINPDGTQTFDTPPTEDAGDAGFEGGEEETFDLPEMDQVVKGVDPALYFLVAVIVAAALWYLLVFRKRESADDDFFSNLDGEKFNLKLPSEVDEYYKIRAKCEEAGWEPGVPPPQGQQQSGPHRLLAQALMKRAMADIPMVMYIQKESAGMSKLYSKSMCSVKQWRAYQQAESLVSNEINEVKAEADEIEPGWSEVIWRQATQYHGMLKKKHEMEAAAAQQKAQMQDKASGKTAAAEPKVDDAKAKEIAAQKAAEELIKQEEAEKQKEKAFASGSGMKKGFLDKKGKKK